MRPLILVTGPGGRVGPLILPYLREHFRLRLFDIKALEVSGDDEFMQGDVRDADRVRQACREVAAVIHLAAISDEDDFYTKLLPYNLEGVYTVFEAARCAGVRQIIFASTGQTVVNYPEDERVTPDMPARPCTVYACTKLFGEALARYYSDHYGMAMNCIRLCYFQPYDSPLIRQPGHRIQRDWCSPGDLAQLLVSCLRASVPFGVYFGISNNRDRVWDIENARRELGYEPKDDASTYLPSGSAEES